jgi:hypothetical protein
MSLREVWRPTLQWNVLFCLIVTEATYDSRNRHVPAVVLPPTISFR